MNDEELTLEIESNLKKDINNLMFMYGDPGTTLGEAENTASIVFYLIKNDLEGLQALKNNIGYDSFEDYWQGKGDRWNGVLDIKKYSQEVWTAARCAKDYI